MRIEVGVVAIRVLQEDLGINLGKTCPLVPPTRITRGPPVRCSIARTKLAENMFGCEAFPVQSLVLPKFMRLGQRDNTRIRRKRADLNAEARKGWIN